MPFTPTHVVAVIPLGYRWPRALPFSALMIGSMVPDWPLFFAYGPSYATTHSFRGIITACLPLGFLVYSVFQAILKRPLFDLLPRSVREKSVPLLQSPTGFKLGDLTRAAVAVAVGATTHIVWDAFTHQGRWGTHLLPALNGVAITFVGLDVPGYKLFQHGSTVVGIPILILCLRQWLRKQPPQPAPPLLSACLNRLTILVALAVPVGLAALAAAKLTTSMVAPETLYRSAFDYVTQTGMLLVVISVGHSVFFHLIAGLSRDRPGKT